MGSENSGVNPYVIVRNGNPFAVALCTQERSKEILKNVEHEEFVKQCNTEFGTKVFSSYKRRTLWTIVKFEKVLQ